MLHGHFEYHDSRGKKWPFHISRGKKGPITSHENTLYHPQGCPFIAELSCLKTKQEVSV